MFKKVSNKSILKGSTLLCCTFVTLAMTGCQESPSFMRQNTAEIIMNNPSPKKFYGGVVGSGISAFATQEYSTGNMSGDLVGLFNERDIDKTMDVVNRLKIANILEFKPSNQWQTWRDGPNNIKYSLKPGRPIFSEDGDKTCRDYDIVLESSIGNRSTSGTACRTGDGNWLLVS